MSSLSLISQTSQTSFGTLPDGRPVSLFTLRNRNGMEIDITNYGGHVVAIRLPDGEGKHIDVALGYNNLAGYLNDTCYLGALIGRYANRIGGAAFTIDGQRYELAVNSGEGRPRLQLHGGDAGFHQQLWQAEAGIFEGNGALSLRYLSPDGEAGFPGELAVEVHYSLTSDNELAIRCLATTTKPTHVSLTNHTYFNLRGEGRGDIRGHQVFINADHITPVNAAMLPTGERMPIAGTPLDLRKPVILRDVLHAPCEQLQLAGGFDHNYVLNKVEKNQAVACAVEPESGRFVEVFTDMPGLQFYSGNFLAGSSPAKSGQKYQPCDGFCLESQYFPDSPNQPSFPSTLLRPGEQYQSTTLYRFGENHTSKV